MPTDARQSTFHTLTIANGATVSDAMQISEFAALGLVMPAAFTGASVSFQVSHDGTTYQALYDTTNNLVSLTVAVSRSYDLPAALSAWRFFKVVSASAEGADRSLVISAKS